MNPACRLRVVCIVISGQQRPIPLRCDALRDIHLLSCSSPRFPRLEDNDQIDGVVVGFRAANSFPAKHIASVIRQQVDDLSGRETFPTLLYLQPSWHHGHRFLRTKSYIQRPTF